VNPLLVVRDVGDDGAAWSDAVPAWSGDAVVPDLTLEGATGDRTDIVWLLLEQMDAWRGRAPIIVGCGEHSLAAETFALAGWVGGLVLVDGLGGAWTTPEEQVARQNVWLRAKFEAPDHVGYPRVWLEPFTRLLRENVRCPVLIVETPASITSVDEVEKRAHQFGGPVEVLRIESAAPVPILREVTAWWDSQPDGR